MALIRFEQPQILAEIADLVIDGTRIKRKARFDSLHYSQYSASSGYLPGQPLLGQSTAGKQEVVIALTIQYFATDANGGYGQPLEGRPGFSSYPFNLRASHDTLVDAATGTVLGDATLLNDPASTQDAYTDGFGAQHPAGVLHGIDYMYEDEFFRRMAVGVPVVVDSLIQQYITTASTNGRF